MVKKCNEYFDIYIYIYYKIDKLKQYAKIYQGSKIFCYNGKIKIATET